MANELITIRDKILEYNNISFEYDLVAHEIPDQQQRLFKLAISTSQIDYIENLEEIFKIIREFIYKTEGKISIIWDDISTYYSVLAYPKINSIENLLRKLITYFMVSNLGIEWTEQNMPIEVKNNIRQSRDKNNFLHDTDFIQLADILFKPYSNKNIDILFKELKSSLIIPDEGKKKYFDQYIPRSNWDRYFNSFINCEDGVLLKYWNKLYELRCLIAHNSFITKLDYEEIINIVSYLSEKFESAIKLIDTIIIPREEKESVIESVLKARSELVTEFLDQWRTISNEIVRLYSSKGFIDEDDLSLSSIVEILVKNETLDENFKMHLKPIGLMRNKITNFSEDLSDNEIKDAITEAKVFFADWILFEIPFL